MGDSIFSKFFNLFKKTKNNDSSGRESTSERYGISTVKDNPLYDQESVGEKYGTDEGATYINPIFDVVAEQELEKQELPENELPKQELAETATETNEPLPVNQLENIGGLPTRESIKMMADGMNLKTIFLYKHFSKALDALDEYQKIMKEERTISINEIKMKRTGQYNEGRSGLDVHAEAVVEAYQAMGEFIYQADLAINNKDGFFAKRSSNVRKLVPVFANLLVQAYGLLPKLAHLESAVAPYLIETDKETYTFSDIINHKVVAGRSGGLAMRGAEENNGVIMISPEEALEAIKSSREELENTDAKENIDSAKEEVKSKEKEVKSKEKEFNRAKKKYESLKESNDKDAMIKANEDMDDALTELVNARVHRKTAVRDRDKALYDRRVNAYYNMMNLRKEKTEQERMKLRIPVMPVGILKAQRQETVDKAQMEALKNRAEKIADAYIAELRPLMTALDDIAESYEFSGETEREEVHDKQAEYFRLSRLFHRVIQNRNLLKNVIINGIPNDDNSQTQGYRDIVNLNSLNENKLSEAVVWLNQQAQSPEKFARLVDEKGNELQAEKDYHVGGGGTSISILDFHNNRVLRAPKADSKYLSDKEQKTALNGIRDEASGKIAQFLGFNVCAQAEAAGFMAKGNNGENETPVFGGSIMEMAKGTEANYINMLMGQDDGEKMIEQRRGEKFRNVDIMKNGRLIGELMKMDVMDYIIQHEDRHAANFLINLDAGENEAMVTAIDNDMVLGCGHSQAHIGGNKSAEALLGINDRALQDYGIKLQSSFPMMTQDVKDALQNIDLGAFNEMLMPYADRVSRLAAVHRASELKKLAKTVPTCDLTTQEGIEKFVKVAARNSVIDWIKGMSIVEREAKGKRYENVNNSGIGGITSKLIYMVAMAYSRSFSNCIGKNDPRAESVEGILGVMKALGLSKKEAEEILRNNLGYVVDKNVDNIQLITETQFGRTNFAKALARYDELLQ